MKRAGNTLCIIDGSSFLYRAQWALKPMHTADGEPVQAIYGFFRMFKKLVEAGKPRYCVVVWDSPGETVRHQLLPSYKAQRQASPAGIHEQKERIQEMLRDMGIAQVAQYGIEADDLIYSLARKLYDEVDTIVVVTGDKDLAQMVDGHVVLYDAFKEVYIDEAGVQEKYGVAPDRMRLLLTLMGDASDNIPGVTGIGKKGAQEIAAKYASCDELYAHLEEVEPARTREKLRAGRSDAFLSEQLVALQVHDIDLDLAGAKFDLTVAWPKARPWFEKLQFVSLLKGMRDASTEGWHIFSTRAGVRIVVVSDEATLKDMCAEIVREGSCALDTEGTCECTPVTMKLAGISVCVRKGVAYYIPIAHTKTEANIDRELVMRHLKPVFENASIKKYLHHAKFDMIALEQFGIKLAGLAVDTLIAAHLTVADGERIGLKSLSERYFQVPMIAFNDLLKHYHVATIADIDPADAAEYAAADAHQTNELVSVMVQRLHETHQWKLYETLELPLVHILADMELTGIPLRAQELHEVSKKVGVELDSIIEQIEALTGTRKGSLNLNSPKQLEQLLFTELKLQPIKKTSGKTGYSTDQEVLVELARHHPVPQLILSYRALAKLKNTYLDALPTYIKPETGRIHTNFSQTSTATGRLASFDPNLQNIPSVNGHGSDVRRAFHAPKGYQFIAADYSQIELRVLAYLSQDERLCNAFAVADADIHALTAAHIFEVPIDRVTHEQRQIGKRINFSILYGLTPYGLSKDLGISYHDAQAYITKYFAQYPGVSTWMEKVIAETKEHGYVTTLGGRRRSIPGIHEKNKHAYDLACRIAINTVAQGTAAEIMKQGMIAVHRLVTKSYDAELVLQIHDELLVQAAESCVEACVVDMQRTLESVVDWNVPLRVTVRTGFTWGSVSK